MTSLPSGPSEKSTDSIVPHSGPSTSTSLELQSNHPTSSLGVPQSGLSSTPVEPQSGFVTNSPVEPHSNTSIAIGLHSKPSTSMIIETNSVPGTSTPLADQNQRCSASGVGGPPPKVARTEDDVQTWQSGDEEEPTVHNESFDYESCFRTRYGREYIAPHGSLQDSMAPYDPESIGTSIKVVNLTDVEKLIDDYLRKLEHNDQKIAVLEDKNKDLNVKISNLETSLKNIKKTMKTDYVKRNEVEKEREKITYNEEKCKGVEKKLEETKRDLANLRSLNDTFQSNLKWIRENEGKRIPTCRDQPSTRIGPS